MCKCTYPLPTHTNFIYMYMSLTGWNKKNSTQGSSTHLSLGEDLKGDEAGERPGTQAL